MKSVKFSGLLSSCWRCMIPSLLLAGGQAGPAGHCRNQHRIHGQWIRWSGTHGKSQLHWCNTVYSDSEHSSLTCKIVETSQTIIIYTPAIRPNSNSAPINVKLPSKTQAHTFCKTNGISTSAVRLFFHFWWVNRWWYYHHYSSNVSICSRALVPKFVMENVF